MDKMDNGIWVVARIEKVEIMEMTERCSMEDLFLPLPLSMVGPTQGMISGTPKIGEP